MKTPIGKIFKDSFLLLIDTKSPKNTREEEDWLKKGKKGIYFFMGEEREEGNHKMISLNNLKL